MNEIISNENVDDKPIELDNLVLTERNPDQSNETISNDTEQIVKNKEKEKEESLPPIGTMFMIAGKSYKVCYINKGQNRFSAEPCSGQY